jgi:hypothetical protein
MDSDFPRPYGWVMPKSEDDSANPPSSNNFYNLTYPIGNVQLIEDIVERIGRQNQSKKMVAW